MIQKSHPKSQFRICHTKSQMAERFFSDKPSIKINTDCDGYGGTIEAVDILQILIYGDNEMLIEYIYKKDIKENVN